MPTKNGDMPAMPILIEGFGQFETVAYTGLTKREQFAMAAMQGFASNGGYAAPWDAAHDAVRWADALLAELDKAGDDV